MIKIERANLNDAEILTKISIESFEDHAKTWGPWTTDSNDSGGAGFNSVNHFRYFIKVSKFYKIIYHRDIIGGIAAYTTGFKHAVIDFFFIHPDYKNKNIGTKVISLIEKEFPNVYRWSLGTSAKSKQNQHFYEKVGYKKTHEDKDYWYGKKIKKPRNNNYTLTVEKKMTKKALFRNDIFSNVEFEDCNFSYGDFYSMNLEGTSFTNSNIKDAIICDSYMPNCKFHNVNLDNSIFGDINLNNIEICEAALGGAYIHDTNLGWGEKKGTIDFERCDFSNSVLSHCNLRGVEFNDCEISGMKINGILIDDLLKEYENNKKLDK